MEQSDGYKSIEAIIRDLEHQLSLCHTKVCEESAAKAEKEIQAQFGKVVDAIAARKEALLKEVAQSVSKHRIAVKEMHGKLENSIKVTKQMLELGASIYPTNKNPAEAIWEESKSISIPTVTDVHIRTALPVDIITAVQHYGEVIDSGEFAQADTISTVAGSTKGYADGKGANAKFNYPTGISFNSLNDCVYICDCYNNSIKKLTLQGEVSTFVASSPLLSRPYGIVMNRQQNVFYVTNYSSHTISKVTSSGDVSRFAGLDGKQGITDGVGSDARFSSPAGIAIDQQTGSLFVSDYGNNMIRKITPQGEVSTLAGKGDSGAVDAKGRAAKFHNPWGIAFDESSQSLLVCDYASNKVRRVLLNGDVSTLCSISRPAYVAVTANKTILVSSYGTNRIYKVTPKGPHGSYEAAVLAGSGKETRVDGSAEQSCFNLPVGLAIHEPSHSCFVAEYDGHSIRKITFK